MATLKKVRMPLKDRPYDIQIGQGAIRRLPSFLKGVEKRGFLIADEKLVDARAVTAAALSKAGWEIHEIPVAAGEGLKDIEAVYPLYGELLRGKANRNSTLFALGGGSVGDAAGFVASTYLRGISWVGLPTTLLAQVDSAIGGKTGINHEAGKNLIGSFHQPSLVVNDIDFLKSLGPREIVSGFGEAVKYGITFDPKFFRELASGVGRFLVLDPEFMPAVIEKCVRWKCKTVARDEFDRKGAREVLNFGHTFGHALEAITGYQVFQHGEAVLWGMRFALALSQVRKKLSAKSRADIEGFLAELPVPNVPANFGPHELFGYMSQDKKVRAGKIHFVLLSALGKTVSDNRVTEKDLLAAYRLLGLPVGAP
jgi:3-dehydroquinate synthase